MSFRKFKGNSFCVGGRHGSGTKIFSGDTISEGSEVLIGHCLICNRKNR